MSDFLAALCHLCTVFATIASKLATPASVLPANRLHASPTCPVNHQKCLTTVPRQLSMATSTQSVDEAIPPLVWACFSTTKESQRHPVFSNAISDYGALIELLSRLPLDFAPGFFDVLQSQTPPSTEFFQSLPAVQKKQWGVYLILLQKAGCSDQIYVGSGTDAKSSSIARLVQYDNDHQVPRHVKRALQDGYSIAHKGIICASPIPTPSLVPITRVLFVAIEAACAFALWAIKQGKKAPSYSYMSQLCPWDVQSLPYIGLCSHNPLHEAVAGDHGFSADELEAQAAIIRQRRAAYYVQWRQKAKEDNAQHYRRKTRENRRLYIQRHPDRERENNLRTIRKAVEEKRNWCKICEHAFTKPCYLKKHLTGIKHARKAASLGLEP